ncbi:hypothetical protein [Prosthecomicrobium sp. N25]|uniref:hypothetical protein n=1 Tax=Prosthecomicrobium sp. N25 TaxID=3129254 RepID=UPI00307845FF
MAPAPRRPTSQLPLDLALPPRRGPEDYVVGEANRAAHDLLEAWPAWPSPVVLVTGPEGSGKSHLVAIWSERAGASVLAARDLGGADPLALAAAGPVVVEDLGPGLDETALFHLVNAVQAAGRQLLLTARTEPAAWGLRLPDLASRLRAATPARLQEPDDALLEALLAKLFADRQAAVDPQLLHGVAIRMERSYAAARDVVEAIDREALAAKAPIARGLAMRVVDRLHPREPELPGLDAEPAADDNPS